MYFLPHRVLNAALTFSTAFLVVSLGASAADSVASNTDVPDYGASPPILTVPTPFSEGDTATGDGGSVDIGGNVADPDFADAAIG